MIQSAMMFALGVFVSGLVWLAFSVALVRRAKRLTERRLLAGVATRRAEFDAERDELRARHAVQMHRLEREVSRVLDMATAYRLEADLKERDLMSARAELAAHREDFVEAETRLMGERESIQDLERRHAEAGSALRAVQHQLKMETKRRAAAEEALDEASILADQRRIALTALRAENNALRARLGEEPGAPLPFELEQPKLPRAVAVLASADGEEPVETMEPAVATAVEAAPKIEVGGSVVPLPTRPRPVPVESPERSAAVVAEAARDLQRIAGEAKLAAEDAENVAVVAQRPRMPEATAPGVTNIGELVALRMASAPAANGSGASQDEPEVTEKAETQFFEALAEIRALKRAGGGNQAAE
jgi:hypothetical protein